MTADVRSELRRTWSNIASYSVAGYALNNGDQFLLDILLGPTAVGIYALGYLLGGGIAALVGEPVSGALGPRIFAEWQEGEDGHHRSRATANKAGRMILALSTVIAAGLLSAGYLGILRPINPSPDLGYVAALIALGTGIGTAASIVWQNLLYLQGRTRLLSLAAWITVTPTIVAVIVLTMAFGVVGTALATVVSYCLLAGLDWWMARSPA